MIIEPWHILVLQNISPRRFVPIPAWHSRPEQIMARMRTKSPFSSPSVFVIELFPILPLIPGQVDNDLSRNNGEDGIGNRVQGFQAVHAAEVDAVSLGPQQPRRMEKILSSIFESDEGRHILRELHLGHRLPDLPNGSLQGSMRPNF